MHAALQTRLSRLLGSRYPIIQTAMGWVAEPQLVAATGDAGGFGFLAGATIPPARLEPAILEVKALSDRPFGLNFHMFQPNAEQAIDLVIRHDVRAVSYGRAPEARMIRKLKDAGVVCMPTIGALKHARKAVELGADALTVQGWEGGGHTGAVATTVLLPQVLDAVQVPLAAAGGFRDGRGLAAALAWGADGVAMGTRFLLTAESAPPKRTLDSYLRCEDPAQVVVSTALDGLPQRMVMNRMLSELEGSGPLKRLYIALRSAMAYRKFTGATLFGLLRSVLTMRRSGDLGISELIMSANAPMIIQKSMVDGDPEAGVLPGGQVAGAIDSLPSCAELIETLVAEASARLDALAGTG